MAGQQRHPLEDLELLSLGHVALQQGSGGTLEADTLHTREVELSSSNGRTLATDTLVLYLGANSSEPLEESLWGVELIGLVHQFLKSG